MILDTAFLIDLLRNNQDAVQKAHELEQQGSPLSTTTITVFELWRGFSALKPEKMEKACAMLDRLRIYPLDIRTAKRGGRIAHVLATTGQGIDPEDAMIAGIALENHEEVLTKNTKHFSRIPQIIINSY
jgi:predicted nucleic acid-binding protein